MLCVPCTVLYRLGQVNTHSPFFKQEKQNEKHIHWFIIRTSKNHEGTLIVAFLQKCGNFDMKPKENLHGHKWISM